MACLPRLPLGEQVAGTTAGSAALGQTRSMTKHIFDQAIALEADPDSPDIWLGKTSPGYWNMVGPYGGISAAILTQAMLLHPALLGEPVALTVNYPSGVAPGPYRVTASPVRTNRSTQHWILSLTQRDAAGVDVVAITATAMTALPRDTWHMNDAPIPDVPLAGVTPRVAPLGAIEWFNRYDMRYLKGDVPQHWDGSGTDSLTRLWVRDDQPRALDFASLTAMSDVFYPRVWLRRATRVAAGTVSMTIYFHASKQQLVQTGTGYLLAQAQAQVFRHGFADQTAQLWNESGMLLVTSHQLVYFKE